MTDQPEWLGRKLTLEQIQQECEFDGRRWFGEEVHCSVGYQVVQVGAEAGEVLSEYKKVLRGEPFTEDSRAALIEEAVDVFISMVCLMNALKANVGDSYDLKRQLNCQRWGFPDGRAPEGAGDGSGPEGNGTNGAGA
jgi:NTP pyrophosphatase (non-canonical NTP hydrolase)